MYHDSKNVSRLKKCVTTQKMCHNSKKIFHDSKNVSRLEKCVTIRKMCHDSKNSHDSKNVSRLKCVTTQNVSDIILVKRKQYLTLLYLAPCLTMRFCDIRHAGEKTWDQNYFFTDTNRNLKKYWNQHVDLLHNTRSRF